MGNINAAIADLNQVIKLNPNEADAYYNRGKARTALGDTKGAIADYNWALRLKPDLAEAYGNRGILYSQTGNKQAALADLHQAAQLFAKHGDQQSYQQTLDFIQQIQQKGSQQLMLQK